jgi:hypothetical protein
MTSFNSNGVIFFLYECRNQSMKKFIYHLKICDVAGKPDIKGIINLISGEKQFLF